MENMDPSFETLQFIVESAHRRGDTITIVATNSTPAIERLTQQYPTKEFGYVLSIMNPNSNSITLEP